MSNKTKIYKTIHFINLVDLKPGDCYVFHETYLGFIVSRQKQYSEERYLTLWNNLSNNSLSTASSNFNAVDKNAMDVIKIT